jgi:16S rRNA (cytosine1402-N4)-methyltransferase
MKNPLVNPKSEHVPVLVEEVVHYFLPTKIKVFFDGTLGAGGHAKRILETHPEIELYIGVDRDQSAHTIAKSHLQPWLDKIQFVHENFSEIEKILDEKKIQSVDGILLDIGVSSMQIDSEIRGFSFQKEAALDMRMDQTQDLTAEKVVNEASFLELKKIFLELGEEKRAEEVAKAICERRKNRKIHTTQELVDVITPVVKSRRQDLHPATLIFQALRIYVNNELGSLEKGLLASLKRLALTKRMQVITFHSLEDRIVKAFFKEAYNKGEVQLVTKKAVAPTWMEQKHNRRSRSAKLRVVEKT